MKGFGVAAAIAGVAAGVLWAFTFSYAQGCTLTGQLVGRSCYPVLANMHSFIGTIALVGLIGGVALFIAGSQQQAPSQPGAWQPPRPAANPGPCFRCHQPDEAHVNGKCPVPPPQPSSAPGPAAPPGPPSAGYQ